MHFVEAKGILSPRNGMNLYRGCTHGCIYCDSRSRCYQINHPFEDIEIKKNAIDLLEKTLKAKRHRCMIGTGAMTDPYIPLESELCYMRRALELVNQYEFGITIQTKSDQILRDLDLLQQINRKTKAVVQMTITTHDDALCRILEPGVCVTSARLAALKRFCCVGIPTVVWLSPILPFINDTQENVERILDECACIGVKGIICFGMGLTLRDGNREYFYNQLDRYFPGMKEHYIHTYGNQYEVCSPKNIELMKLFHKTCERYGIIHDNDQIFRYLGAFEERNAGSQIKLF